MASGEDDFAAFLAEVNEAKPIEEGQQAEAAPTDGRTSTSCPAAGKRARDEEDGKDAGPQGGTMMASAPAPVLKKAKVIVAKAKPQIFTSQDQQAAAAAAATAAAASVSAEVSGGAAGPIAPAFAGGVGGMDAASNGGYPMQMQMQMQMQMPPHAGMMGFAPQPPQVPQAPQPPGQGFTTVAAAAAMANKKPKKFVRVGATTEETYEDPTLNEWPDNDFRLFCGDLGNDVTDEVLANAFRHKYPSFAKAKVIRDKYKGKSKGYGFVSFLDPFEGLKALREMNLKYIGSRPVKLRKSDWKDRNLQEVKKKEKEKKKLLSKLGLS